jgi:NAD(P)-dependent dehydrogenase (short-subunit alcohol dehydrogenase family)
MKLQGRTAVITGGGRGIGQATAFKFAQEGAQVLIAARTVSELAETAQQIEERGGGVEYVQMDVRERDDVLRAVETALRRFSRVDVLVNCAGIHGPIGLMAEVDVNEWIKAVETNLFGTFMMCRAVLPHMIRQHSGKIINFSGGGATSPLPRLMAYGVSKTAVVRLTETLAQEVREFNIQVNAIAPGVVDTRLQDDIIAAGERAGDLAARMRKLRETGEGGIKPEVPAGLALFLASDDSQGLTGKLISAPHDPWPTWGEKAEELSASAMYTLRRMDPFTIRPLLVRLQNEKR